MNIETAVNRDINKLKNRLKKRAQKDGLYENFGEVEFRKLKDKHGYFNLVYGTREERRAAAAIEGFGRWCMNFDLSQI